MSDTTHSEIELLRRLHRGAMVTLSAVKQLQERTPEDDLRLRALVRLAGRLSDRIQWVQAQANLDHAKRLHEEVTAPRRDPLALGVDANPAVAFPV